MLRSKYASINFSIYIFLTFYVFGGSMVNALVGYPTWYYVGANEFAKFHQMDTSLIIPVFVIFFFLLFIPLLLLFWLGPPVIPRWMVLGSLALYLINLVSTVTIQIPIQGNLDNGFSSELIDRLIYTDFVFRRSTITLMSLLGFGMLFRVIRSAN